MHESIFGSADSDLRPNDVMTKLIIFKPISSSLSIYLIFLPC